MGGWGKQWRTVSGSRGGTLQPISRSRGPPGRPGWCCLETGGVLAARGSVHLLSLGQRTGLEAVGCEHRCEDRVAASSSPCSFSLTILEPQGRETRRLGGFGTPKTRRCDVTKMPDVTGPEPQRRGLPFAARDRCLP